MDLETLVNHYGGQTAFARLLGCARQDINRAVRRSRPLSSRLAIRIYEKTGQMFDIHGQPLTPSTSGRVLQSASGSSRSAAAPGRR